MNKRGISQIVITLLMIVLVLGAISIIFVIVNNLLNQGVADVASTTQCLKINIVATKMICAGENCDVTINRKAGGDDIGGVKLVFSNSDTGNIGTTVEDVAGNIPELGTKVASELKHGLEGETPDTVEIVAYLTDQSREAMLCSQTNKFKF